MGRKHKSFPDESEKSQKIKALRKTIQQRDKEIQRLKAELKTLNEAFSKSARYMSKESQVLTTEQLIKAANDDLSLEQAKQEIEIDAETERERVRKKWDAWNRNRKTTE